MVRTFLSQLGLVAGSDFLVSAQDWKKVPVWVAWSWREAGRSSWSCCVWLWMIAWRP